MTAFLRTLATGGAVAALLGAPATAAATGPHASDVALGEPLPRAHAHNDYEHDRPLLDALEHGFTSVEADVRLVDGELRVAHDAWEVDDAPTLEEAYLEPAHEEGYRVRFWATDDLEGEARENLWTELRAAGMDHINTDDLAGLQEFLSR